MALVVRNPRVRKIDLDMNISEPAVGDGRGDGRGFVVAMLRIVVVDPQVLGDGEVELVDPVEDRHCKLAEGLGDADEFEEHVGLFEPVERLQGDDIATTNLEKDREDHVLKIAGQHQKELEWVDHGGGGRRHLAQGRRSH